jgi:hypothetical protein
MLKCTTDVMPTYVLGTLHSRTMHSDQILFLSDAAWEPNPLIHSFVSFITCLLIPSTVFSFFLSSSLLRIFFLHPFLDAFVFSRKAPTCCVMSVRPSVCINSGPIGRISVKFDTSRICPGNPSEVKIGQKYTVPKECLY